MAELTKFGATEVSYHIRHDLREIPEGRSYGNEAVDRSLSRNNYSLLKDRCQSSGDANKYRKEIESQCFHYNRKNLVHAVEIAVQCPSDCPFEQKEAFFQETYNYICSTLPMGEKCVFVAQVHADERHYSPSGEMISKDHLHVMYVPAVPDTKHEGFDYRLCADELTKRAKLKSFHPGLQKHLDKAGIQATVFRKKEGSGKAVALSVSQLKELTEKTGITLDHTLTVDELAEIINANILNQKQTRLLKAELKQKDSQITILSSDLKSIKQDYTKSQEKVNTTTSENEMLHKRIQKLEAKVDELQNKSQTVSTEPQEHRWGYTEGWGTHSTGWGNRNMDVTTEEDKTW